MAFFLLCKKKKKNLSSCLITQGWSYAFSPQWIQGYNYFHFHLISIMIQFYPPFQSNPKIVGGLPCPDPVGGLDPPETLSLNHTTFLFRLKLFFMKPKLQEPPRALGGSHLLSLEMLVTFFHQSWAPLLILHLGVGGKGEWGGGGDVWPKLFYLLSSSTLRHRWACSKHFSWGSARNTVDDRL